MSLGFWKGIVCKPYSKSVILTALLIPPLLLLWLSDDFQSLLLKSPLVAIRGILGPRHQYSAVVGQPVDFTAGNSPLNNTDDVPGQPSLHSIKQKREQDDDVVEPISNEVEAGEVDVVQNEGRTHVLGGTSRAGEANDEMTDGKQGSTESNGEASESLTDGSHGSSREDKEAKETLTNGKQGSSREHREANEAFGKEGKLQKREEKTNINHKGHKEPAYETTPPGSKESLEIQAPDLASSTNPSPIPKSSPVPSPSPGPSPSLRSQFSSDSISEPTFSLPNSEPEESLITHSAPEMPPQISDSHNPPKKSPVKTTRCPPIPKLNHYAPLVLPEDEEARQQEIDRVVLGQARAEIARSGPYADSTRRGRVAFLFLTKGLLPLDRLWDWFFKGHEAEYAIHIHSSDATWQYNASTTSFPGFYGRQIPSIQIGWGSVTMVTATRRLLGTALLDPMVERFVLLSEACVPIHNFTFLQEYLFSTNKSHLASHRQSKRYSRGLSPLVQPWQWRKGSQWFVLTRRHAAQVVMDDAFYNKFKSMNFKIADEHYIQTLMAVLGEDSNLEQRSVTFTQFEPCGWHPAEFHPPNTTQSAIQQLQTLTKYDSLDRKVREYAEADSCLNGGRGPVPCYLFARKFVPSTVGKLLGLTNILGY